MAATCCRCSAVKTVGQLKIHASTPSNAAHSAAREPRPAESELRKSLWLSGLGRFVAFVTVGFIIPRSEVRVLSPLVFKTALALSSGRFSLARSSGAKILSPAFATPCDSVLELAAAHSAALFSLTKPVIHHVYSERLIGSIRRECLRHVIVLNERHLVRILRSNFDYYLHSRTHLSLNRNSPIKRKVEPPERGRLISIPQVGGLHHRYCRAA